MLYYSVRIPPQPPHCDAISFKAIAGYLLAEFQQFQCFPYMLVNSKWLELFIFPPIPCIDKKECIGVVLQRVRIIPLGNIGKTIYRLQKSSSLFSMLRNPNLCIVVKDFYIFHLSVKNFLRPA